MPWNKHCTFPNHNLCVSGRCKFGLVTTLGTWVSCCGLRLCCPRTHTHTHTHHGFSACPFTSGKFVPPLSHPGCPSQDTHRTNLPWTIGPGTLITSYVKGFNKESNSLLNLWAPWAVLTASSQRSPRAGTHSGPREGSISTSWVPARGFCWFFHDSELRICLSINSKIASLIAGRGWGHDVPVVCEPASVDQVCSVPMGF